MMHPLFATDLDEIIARCPAVWQSLRGARLFITGGTGFIGRWLLESLAWANDRLQLNAEALVLSRDPIAFAKVLPHVAQHPMFRWQQGDVRDFPFERGDFSHIIHGATEASAELNRSKPIDMFEVIVAGSKRVFDFALQCGAQNVLLLSSGAVYGAQPGDLAHLSESFNGAPVSLDSAAAYGMGKCSAEHLAALYHAQHGLNIRIARCFAFIGPHLPLTRHFAIGNFIDHGLRGQPLAIKGDGRPYRSYQYASDLSVWLWTILCQGQAARPYNVGSDQAYTIAEVARQVAAAFAEPLAIDIAQAPGAGPAERYIPSIDRARSELGLDNSVPLASAIQKTLAWYRLHKEYAV